MCQRDNSAEDYVKEERPTQTDIEALRNALFEVLIEMARGMSTTIEGRETVATLYEVRGIGMHPAVTSVLQEAAERLRQV